MILKNGARLVHQDTTFLSVSKPNDTFVERQVYEYRGKDVQVHRHDRDDNFIIVFVGWRSKITTLSQVDRVVEEMI